MPRAEEFMTHRLEHWTFWLGLRLRNWLFRISKVFPVARRTNELYFTKHILSQFMLTDFDCHRTEHASRNSGDFSRRTLKSILARAMIALRHSFRFRSAAETHKRHSRQGWPFVCSMFVVLRSSLSKVRRQRIVHVTPSAWTLNFAI